MTAWPHASDPIEPSTITARRDPLRRVARLLVLTDLLCLVAADFVALSVRWGEIRPVLIPALWHSGGIVLAGWMLSFALVGAYDTEILGSGIEEFRRVVAATFVTVGIVAVVSYMTKLSLSRGFVLVVAPLGLAFCFVSRFVVRGWLQRARRNGHLQRRVVLVGKSSDNDRAAAEFSGNPVAGFKVIGRVDVESGRGAAEQARPAPVAEVMRAAALGRADAIAICSSGVFGRDDLSRLGWLLPSPGVDLIVVPEYSLVAGPRSVVRTLPGVGMVHLDTPRLSSGERVVKRLFDLVLVVPLILLLLPVMGAIWLGVRLTSPGRGVFTQDRIGEEGRPFAFPKFRSMVDGAHESREAALGDPGSEGDRYRSDPRITSVGRWLRRYSLDELPQLFCVLRGTMSLVGPRPMLPEELVLLGPVDHQRHLIKPGVTGLWQVSGRKNLEWDERMRLDLFYVSEWSLAMDLTILLRTCRAVFSGEGAY